MKTLGGLLLSAATYLLAGLLLVLIVHALLPGEADARGHVTGRTPLLLDVGANAIACFLAGAVASGGTHFRARTRGLVACGLILAIAIVSTLSFWNATPAWYNWAILATTPPFTAIGVAWRKAARADTLRSEAR
jgi:hypothetical protein